MSDSEVIDLRKAQLVRATNVVQSAARRDGVGYALWPEVQDLVTAGKVDRVEIADALERCVVVETGTRLGCPRYRVEVSDPDCSIETAVVSVHEDRLVIEVVTLKLKEK